MRYFPQPLRRAIAPLFIGLVLAGPSLAQEAWLTRPLKLIVPTAAGGPTDMVGRVLAERLAPALGQAVVVDNRPGAGHVIGMGAVAQAAPDGSTWGMVTTPFVVAPALNDKLPFSPQRDFVPVSLLASSPLVLIISGKLQGQVKTIQDLIALAKRSPGALNMASAGNTTGPHLAGELFASMAGIKVTHVPYKGGPQATMSIVSGEADFYFDTPTAAIPHIKTGRVAALGVTSLKRAAVLPDTPAVAEVLPGYEVASWTGMVAPRGTPQPIVDRMHAEAIRAINQPEVKARFATSALEVIASSSEDFAKYIAAELPKWKKLVVEAKITN